MLPNKEIENLYRGHLDALLAKYDSLSKAKCNEGTLMPSLLSMSWQVNGAPRYTACQVGFNSWQAETPPFKKGEQHDNYLHFLRSAAVGAVRR